MSSIIFYRDIEYLKEKEEAIKKDMHIEIGVAAAKFALSIVISAIDYCLRRMVVYRNVLNEEEDL